MGTTTMSKQNGIEAEIGQREIERMVTRGGKFLRAVGTRPAIRSQLLAVGYNVEEHQTGWQLFLKLCGYELRATTTQPEVQAAIDALDVWDGPAFIRARAALDRFFPEQAAYIFAGLEAQSGLASVAACKHFLDRVVALRKGSDPERAATRQQDLAAVALLEQRKVLCPELEARLRELLEIAMQLSHQPSSEKAREDEVQQDARRFKGWLGEWRATAAAVITRRDHLISLGLATRRSASSSADQELDDESEGETDSETDVVLELAQPAAPAQPGAPAQPVAPAVTPVVA